MVRLGLPEQGTKAKAGNVSRDIPEVVGLGGGAQREHFRALGSRQSFRSTCQAVLPIKVRTAAECREMTKGG